MNADPVLIVDDDVDMEPVVIIDEDDENTNNERTVDVPSAPTVETIDLDDETPIITGVETINNNTTKYDKKSEVTFVNNLKNNRLMDKIVTRCINMENATGMPRVIYKTLLPLYRDTSNRFKKSEEFRALLKKTYRQLMRDPDHKFLHIKTLCEELKSGGLRRKVPFVTLATNLKNNGSQRENQELTSISREINYNNAENIQNHQIKALKQYRNRKRVNVPRTKEKTKKAQYHSSEERNRIETRSFVIAEKEKTNIIDVDDSETESSPDPKNNNAENYDRENDDGQNEVIIIEETETSDQINDDVNTGQQEALEEDSNKENNHKNGQSLENEMDYDLLIPTNVCNVVVPTNVSNTVTPTNICNLAREVIHCKRVPHLIEDRNKVIIRLEMQIANDKAMIDRLEEQEVLSEHPYKSPYYLCSKYKENIVKCYKQICELIGESKDIVKRREIRLHVAEGHPPGPSKRLEQFLNSTIDTTGSVEFPDFADVVQCVIESNLSDKLGWNRQQVIHEAVALFRQCGQALRKRRQKREYRDLLSLVRNKNEADDPAEKDPVLLAKLEENKLIAKVKEEEILDRFVRMENYATRGRFGNPHAVVGNTPNFESDKDSSDSETESEQNITIPNNIITSTVNNQHGTGECSRSNVSLSLVQTNNLILTSAPINNHSNVTQSYRTDQVVVNNLLVPSTAAPSTLNPTLLNLLIVPATPLYVVPNTITNQNQIAIRESSITNDAISNNRLSVQPTNTTISSVATMHNDRETMECSDREDRTIFRIGSSSSETVAGIINRNNEISSTKNIENTDRQVIETCNVSGVQENISSKTEVEQNCDSSKEGNVEDVVKREPLDIQSMLDELGDGFVCQVFDVEDPFLVIEISSDGYSDDEEL